MIQKQQEPNEWRDLKLFQVYFQFNHFQSLIRPCSKSLSLSFGIQHALPNSKCERNTGIVKYIPKFIFTSMMDFSEIQQTSNSGDS